MIKWRNYELSFITKNMNDLITKNMNDLNTKNINIISFFSIKDFSYKKKYALYNIRKRYGTIAIFISFERR